MRIDVNNGLGFQVAEAEADPLVFVPAVNFAKLKAATIIDDF